MRERDRRVKRASGDVAIRPFDGAQHGVTSETVVAVGVLGVVWTIMREVKGREGNVK